MQITSIEIRDLIKSIKYVVATDPTPNRVNISPDKTVTQFEISSGTNSRSKRVMLKQFTKNYILNNYQDWELQDTENAESLSKFLNGIINS